MLLPTSRRHPAKLVRTSVAVMPLPANGLRHYAHPPAKVALSGPAGERHGEH
jgi:hypothetical protein